MGITPARAGTAVCDTCGAIIFDGSPPLARGRQEPVTLGGAEVRITPARAGAATSTGPGSLRRWDHPRSRGDGLGGATPAQMFSGSPPLARGRLDPGRWDADLPGITPARAGTAPSKGAASKLSTDHPRSRGDGYGPTLTNAADNGSPPLARGRPPAHHRGQAKRPPRSASCQDARESWVRASRGFARETLVVCAVVLAAARWISWVWIAVMSRVSWAGLRLAKSS